MPNKLLLCALLPLAACVRLEVEPISKGKLLRNPDRSRTFRVRTTASPDAEGLLLIQSKAFRDGQGKTLASLTKTRFELFLDGRLTRTYVIEKKTLGPVRSQRLIHRSPGLGIEISALEIDKISFQTSSFRGALGSKVQDGETIETQSLRFGLAEPEDFLAAGFEPGTSFEKVVLNLDNLSYRKRRFTIGERKPWKSPSGVESEVYEVTIEDLKKLGISDSQSGEVLINETGEMVALSLSTLGITESYELLEEKSAPS